jgi:hypothetical protein
MLILAYCGTKWNDISILHPVLRWARLSSRTAQVSSVVQLDRLIFRNLHTFFFNKAKITRAAAGV